MFYHIVIDSSTCSTNELLCFINYGMILIHALLPTGEPGKVELNCTARALRSLYMYRYTITCNWSDPFIISGLRITNYMVAVLNDAVVFNDTAVSKNHFVYNVSMSGVYHINVVPYVNDLQGETSDSSVTIEEGICNKTISHTNQRQIYFRQV